MDLYVWRFSDYHDWKLKKNYCKHWHGSSVFHHYKVYPEWHPHLPRLPEQWFYPRTQNIKDEETARIECYKLGLALTKKYGRED